MLAFQSFASDLAPGDYNDRRDVFVVFPGADDTNADGLDDDWEVAYFGTLIRNGAGDGDQDGQTDAEEFLAGTDPTNEGSVLQALTVTSPGSTATTIVWAAVPDCTYRVQFKDTVDASGWHDLPDTVMASGSTGAAVDASAGPQSQRFYRVVLVP